MIGKNLNNRYTITARLGKGAMGTVYRATDSQTGQEVALKIISNDLALDPAMLERFKREGEALRQLKHTNIVGYIDAFEHDEQYVIVMEYVASGNLHDLIKKGLMPIERATQIALELCDALIRSHRSKIIHRDIKPENILIDRNGTPKLADFGVARLSEGTRMTHTGTKVGTPYYMAPEAWKGETINAQADIWSLGVVLYEMLAGTVPFDGDSEFTVMTKVTTTPPPDLKKLRKDVPARLVEIVTHMLARDKAERYQTMREVAVDLERGENTTTAKQTRIIFPKAKIDFSRYRIFLIFGVVILGILVAINFLSSLEIPNQPTTQNTQIIINSPTNTKVSLTSTPIPVTSTPEFGIGSTMVSNKDGMTLVFIPAGEFIMGSEDGNSDEQPVHTVNLDAFWIDQTEVTNAMYTKCVSDGACKQSGSLSSYIHTSYFGVPIFDDYPVMHMDWNMASTYCSWADRRLPTEAEWEKAARGTDGRTYPWGEEISCDNANYYDGNKYCVGDTTKVRSYESGKSIYGAYDMAGNVWEWVSSLNQSYPYDATDGRENLSSSDARVLRGGSFYYYGSDVRSAFRFSNVPSDTNLANGFRCALTASKASSNEQPNQAVNENITPTPELGIGSTLIGADGAILMYVPEGRFMMGSDSGGDDEKPINQVNLDAFWIDKTEVTNAMYAKCVDAGICKEPTRASSYTHTSYYGNSEFDNYPVLYVDWDMAKAYCVYAERRLPSEAEWEKAARGTDERTYPWGNEAPNSALLNYNNEIGDATEVGKYPEGASVYGALDMSGNVWELVSSLYFSYPYNAGDGREKLSSSESRVRRGGSWSGYQNNVRSAYREAGGDSEVNVGFRCARSP